MRYRGEVPSLAVYRWRITIRSGSGGNGGMNFPSALPFRSLPYSPRRPVVPGRDGNSLLDTLLRWTVPFKPETGIGVPADESI